MQVFRITHRKWSGKLTASGVPARWNSSGVFIVYCTGSRALACLENVVHKGLPDLKGPFVTMIIDIPADLKIPELLPGELPAGWQASGEIGYGICRPFGDSWIAASEAVILKVPSAIIPGDFNYLINPGHPDFHKIFIFSEEKFLFDDRIKSV